MNDANRVLHAAGLRLPLAGFVLDLGGDELRDASGQSVELRPQAFQVLRFLALNAGKVVSKDELHAAVWSGLIVTDDSLVQAVGDLRRALGDTEHRVVKTVPRRGYTLVADAVAAPAEVAIAPQRGGAGSVDPSPVGAVAATPPRRARSLRLRVLAALLGALSLAGVLVGALVWRDTGTTARPSAASGQRMPDRPSIAILAFRDPSGDAAGRLLARGVAEDLVAELARNVDLRVVSTSSSFSFAGRDVPPAEIGLRLRSRYLIDGTVRRDDQVLRVGVEMIDSQDGHIVWSAQHVADSANLPATRDTLVRRIAGSLHSKLRLSEERRALARPPKTLDVYAMTLRAIALKHQFRPQAAREARQLLEQAIAIDPEYAPAWLYLGMLNGLDSLLRLTGEWHPGRYREMLAQSQRAIQLDPQLPAAYVGLAVVHLHGGRQFSAALAAAQRCVELGPSDADCLMMLSIVQSRIGQAETAMQNMDKALDLSPIPPVYMNSPHALALWVNRRLDEAVRVADDCIEKAPRELGCRRLRMLALAELGRLDEARQEAAWILAQLPTVTSAWFVDMYADDANSLRARATAAALAAGIPAAPPAPTGR